MTQQRRDNNSTEYGIWLRQQTEIDSSLGFVATNIDYIWYNYKTKQYLFKEEKRYGKFPKKYQVDLFRILDRLADNDDYYCGFHCLIFENTSPEDGRIYLDGKFISRTDLIKFLKFEQEDSWYSTWFPEINHIGINFSILDKEQYA